MIARRRVSSVSLTYFYCAKYNEKWTRWGLKNRKWEGEKVFYWNLSNIRIYREREREREELKIRNSRVYFSTNRYTVSGGASRVCVYEIMESWRNIKVRREGETTKGKRGGRA